MQGRNNRQMVQVARVGLHGSFQPASARRIVAYVLACPKDKLERPRQGSGWGLKDFIFPAAGARRCDRLCGSGGRDARV